MGNDNLTNLLYNVKEVEVVFSKESANKLLKQGWILLSVESGQERTDPNDVMPYFKFCFGKIKDDANQKE